MSSLLIRPSPDGEHVKDLPSNDVTRRLGTALIRGQRHHSHAHVILLRCSVVGSCHAVSAVCVLCCEHCF